MNYIKEINAFRNYLKTNSLEAITQALWYVIIDYHNSCNWERWIAIDNQRLMAELSISEKTLIRHRNKLIQAGLLEYKSQQRKKSSGRYKLLSFGLGETGRKDKTAVKKTADGKAAGGADKGAVEEADGSDIYKLNETKQNEDDDDVNPFAYYQKNIGPMLPYIAGLIAQYQKDLPDELITEAFRLAVKNNARSMRYAEKIMLSWLDKGIRTMADYRRHEAEWESQKAKPGLPRGEPQECRKELRERRYSQGEIEAAAKYIKKQVDRYAGNDVIGFIRSLGYPEEVQEGAIDLLTERKELMP